MWLVIQSRAEGEGQDKLLFQFCGVALYFIVVRAFGLVWFGLDERKKPGKHFFSPIDRIFAVLGCFDLS